MSDNSVGEAASHVGMGYDPTVVVKIFGEVGIDVILNQLAGNVLWRETQQQGVLIIELHSTVG